MGIVSGSKMMFFGKNYHFFLIFNKFDMILMIDCIQRALVFEPFIRGTYKKVFFKKNNHYEIHSIHIHSLINLF